jgi:membrane dipeptidase
LLAVGCVIALNTGAAQDKDYRRIHADAIVVDTHNDVVQRALHGEDLGVLTHHGHSDLPRFKQGGVDVQMFSIWVPPERTKRSYYDQANEQIDSIESLARRNPSAMGIANSTADIKRLVGEGKFCAMYGMEGGHPIDSSLKKLEYFYKRGVRYMTLTWNNSTGWATSASDETNPDAKLAHRGLTDLGKKIVRKMNDLGMMVDVSHVGEQTFWDVIKTTRKPIIASHSSAWALCHHRRNLKDDQLKAIKKNGGVVFINFNPGFIDSTYSKKEEEMLAANKGLVDSLGKMVQGDDFIKEQYTAEMMMDKYDPIRPAFSTLMDHFDYVAKLIGVDHVGIGSDFDGIRVTPKNMDDVTYLPEITKELLKRGYSEKDVKKILGGNFMRVLKAVETR